MKGTNEEVTKLTLKLIKESGSKGITETNLRFLSGVGQVRIKRAIATLVDDSLIERCETPSPSGRGGRGTTIRPGWKLSGRKQSKNQDGRKWTRQRLEEYLADAIFIAGTAGITEGQLEERACVPLMTIRNICLSMFRKGWIELCEVCVKPGEVMPGWRDAKERKPVYTTIPKEEIQYVLSRHLSPVDLEIMGLHGVILVNLVIDCLDNWNHQDGGERSEKITQAALRAKEELRRIESRREFQCN